MNIERNTEKIKDRIKERIKERKGNDKDKAEVQDLQLQYITLAKK